MLFFGGRVQGQDASLRANLKDSPRASRFKSELQFQFESYVSANRPVYPTDAYHQNLNIDWAPQAESRKNLFGYKVDSEFRISVGEEWIFPRIKDLYTNVNEVKVGFVHKEWNSFEEDWRLGLFAPRFMDNKLTPGQGSLLGLFYKKGGFTIGALPVFIPEIGPSMKLQDGQFVSKNPWFGAPPSQLLYRGEFAPVRYTLETPPIEDIVLKPGIVLSYEKKWSSSFTRLSLAHKPMPQPVLNFPADQQFIVGSSESYFSASIKPQFFYHTLASMDHSQEFGEDGLVVTGSLAHEIPHEDQRPSEWVTQQFGPATFFSMKVTQPLEELSTSIYASNFLVWGGDEPDQGRYAGDETFFEKRQFYRNAYALGLKTNWPSKQNFASDFRATFDVDQNAGWVGIYNNYQVSKDFGLDLNVEWLGVVSESQKVKDGFLSVYRGNDRVELGVSYVY